MAEETILNDAGEPSSQGVAGEQMVTGEPMASADVAPRQPQQQTGFDYGKMVGAEGALAENWKDGLPEAVRHEKCLDNFKTIGALAQSYVHAQRAIGANKVILPTENSSPEEWSAFYKACGRPDDAGGYRHDAVKLPEGIVLDEAQLSQFREFAFENGFSQKAFEAALAFDVQRLQTQQQAAMAAQAAEYHETLDKLRTEFGGSLETVVAQCNKAMETFGLAEVLREKGLLNNYAVIKALAGIGGKISESKLKGDGAQISAGDPASRLAEIQGNPDDPYYKKDHPAHNARVSEVNGLLAAMARAGRKQPFPR